MTMEVVGPAASPLPPFAGSCRFYFHDPANKLWGLKDYINLSTIGDWSVFKSSFSSVFERDPTLRGGYFFMKDPYPPLYEDRLNNRGGAYQIKIDSRSGQAAFELYSIAMILNRITKNPENKIVGISISLKLSFYILKLWNLDAARFNNVDDIYLFVPSTSVIYERHITRPL
jgi:hypothetical protein